MNNSLVWLLIIFSPCVFLDDVQEDRSEVAVAGECDIEVDKSSFGSDPTDNTEVHDSKVEAASFDITNSESNSSSSVESDEIKVIKSYANISSEAHNDAEETNADVDIDVDSTEEEISEDIVKLMQVCKLSFYSTTGVYILTNAPPNGVE